MHDCHLINGRLTFVKNFVPCGRRAESIDSRQVSPLFWPSGEIRSVSVQPSPSALYQDLLARAELRPDADQARAVATLEGVFEGLTTPPLPSPGGPMDRVFRRKNPSPQAPRGVYLHGGPGRGKSMLMDLFYRALPESVTKRRVHFHAFMIGVHDDLHAHRAEHAARGGVDTALPDLAARLAAEVRVLCFDEFHVTDVADAMILGRLFTALFEAGLCVVATSNWAPERLYEGGLQRDRFEPFIALLREKMHVVTLDGPVDYRGDRLVREGTYFTPLDATARARLDALFSHLTGDSRPESLRVEVKGRLVEIPIFARGVGRMDFTDLCVHALGAEDYLAIAGVCHTLFVENIPKIPEEKRNEAKRLMTLIDVLYDTGTRAVFSARTGPEEIYTGHDHGLEFARTISRLTEMQDPKWLEERTRRTGESLATPPQDEATTTRNR